ncbi:hypothetical protein H2201_007710 [Coniosporium apollinis]|uniref:Uncharacterized protein n=1 Tax=Coniosporium apollinis TaxID=61459 RepID=A0ABQ9NNJ5_9PEZI|nr:hypothetical protein H2201_007710 [Coniosporium apollinis]
MFTTTQWNSGGIGSKEMTLSNKVRYLRSAKRRAIRYLNLEASYYWYDEGHRALLERFGFSVTDFHQAALNLEELRITLVPRALDAFWDSYMHDSVLSGLEGVVVDAVAQMGRLKRVFLIRANKFPEGCVLRLYKNIELLVESRLAMNGWTTTQDSAGRIMIVDSREDRAEQRRYVFPDTTSPSNTHILSLLPTNPPTRSLAIGTTTAIPPTPASFTENHDFLRVLDWVLSEHAVHDPDVQSQAAAFASTAGSNLGSGGVFFPANHPSRRPERRRRGSGGPGYGGGGGTGGDGAGAASVQGGAGGAGRGGWLHVSDQRNPPDYGRIAWPEDIFGSVEVDGQGKFVGKNGNYQSSGTYRVVTREGILGLSKYLRERVVERLKELEAQQKERER